jgi:hypothetical protein
LVKHKRIIKIGDTGSDGQTIPPVAKDDFEDDIPF